MKKNSFSNDIYFIHFNSIFKCWKYRVEGPHVDGVNNDWHVQVEKGKVKGAERVAGGVSHKKN